MGCERGYYQGTTEQTRVCNGDDEFSRSSVVSGCAGPWPPGRATDIVRQRASNEAFSIHWTAHAKNRMEERELVMSDVLHVLKHGFIYEEGEEASRPGLYKYSNSR